MRKRTITGITVVLLLFVPFVAIAQDGKDMQKDYSEGFYIGLKGGLPFGMSTFSSFGADKTRFGMSGGIYGGYRFSHVWSLEASAAFGKLDMSAQDCCIEKGYWLGIDGNRYNAPVTDMEGYGYSDLKNSVSMQRYGLHLNVNLLGLIKPARYGRWSVGISPAVYAVGTKATIKTISSGKQLLKGGNEWHLGVGGDLNVSYRITDNLSAGAYSGITYLAGKRMDGVPEHLHKNNYIWESGIRIGWAFGKTVKHKKATIAPMQQTESIVEYEKPSTEQNIVKDSVISEHPMKDEIKVTVTDPTERTSSIKFPIISFSFNSVWIEPSQRTKLHEIKLLLEKNPQTTITISGWCDNKGSEDVNKRISAKRADAVKLWLVRRGISTERIITEGCGIDRQQTDVDKVRRAEIKERRN